MAIVEVPGIGNVEFPDSMSTADMAKAIQKMTVQQKAKGDTPEKLAADATAFNNYGQQKLKQLAAGNPANQFTTPEQQLRADNNPLTSGLGAMADEAMAGGGQALGGDGLFQKIMGLARIANSPGVGAGNAVGTTVQNILANVPGLGGAGGVVPAGGAALADAATQLVAGPKIIEGAIRGTKAIGQIAPRILAPGALRRAGSEAIAMELGAPATTMERVFETPASKAAYQLAEAQGPVKTKGLADAVESAFFEHGDMSNPKRQALTYLSNLEGKLRQGSSMSYGQAMKEIQALKAEADSAFSGMKPNVQLGKTLMDTREKMIETLDKVSETYRAANRLYRQEQATIDIMNAVRAGTPGTNFEKLIENSPDVAKAFSPKVIKEITHIATELSDVASSTPAGGFRQALQAMAKPVTDMMTTDWGRAILRSTLRTPSEKLPKALAGAVQTYRAMTPRAQADQPAQ